MSEIFDKDLRSHLEAAAWIGISRNFEWSEQLLEKYQDKVDWNAISANEEIRWTIPMIAKFAERLDWEEFSEYVKENSYMYTLELIEAFKDKWDWHAISANRKIRWTIPMLAKFAERLDWEKFSKYANENTYTPEIIEAFKDKWDWHAISANEEIRWTIPMIAKFAERLDWEEFSGRVSGYSFTYDISELIEAFKDKLDWHELSTNFNVTPCDELLEKYADLWDWNEIIKKRRAFEGEGIDFYKRYKEYIPQSTLQNSSLWREMIEQQKEMLIKDIIP